MNPFEKVINPTRRASPATYFRRMVKLMKSPTLRTVAVAAAADNDILEIVSAARKMKILGGAILFGDKTKIINIAAEYNINIKRCKIVDTHSDEESAASAVAAVREGRADLIMKGNLDTMLVANAMIDKSNGVRDGKRLLSHISVMYRLSNGRMFIYTDTGMNIDPDIETKKHIILNAVDFEKNIGIEGPKVVLEAAHESNTHMQSVKDANELNPWGRGQGIEMFGPMDIATTVNKKIANKKEIVSPAGSNGDILVFHNIDAANGAMKELTVINDMTGDPNMENFLMGGLMIGGKVLAVVSSRGDSYYSKIWSIILAIRAMDGATARQMVFGKNA